ncbi:MAG: alcohol dehydrogenase catalytic domain-containing protein [Hamadaea sp.]|nr:alcohol dehydrogenase catalytic domain-containing protein [Hamadaea sp.]NUT07337.1 alcohol dehydrogenase catalytic domain-containing protein [Hamadaea sp.]
MLAGRLDVRSRKFTVEDVPTPQPGPGEVLVKVEAAGVCLSDVHLIEGGLTPLYLEGGVVTLGHEVAGVVAEPGPGVTAWRPGQRVLLQAGEERGGQVWTRGVDYDGGWAEYALATESTLVAIPDDLSFEQASIIPDAVSTPWAAITTTAQTPPAVPVGVWGVGGLGAHAVQLLRLIGAAPIIAFDPLAPARERAVEFGADLALDPGDPDVRRQVGLATGGAGLARAFDFAGVPPVREQAAKCLGKDGRLTLVGLTDKPLTISDGTRFSYLGQQILGHYGSTDEHVRQLVDLVRLHRIDFARSISDVVPLAQAEQAVERLQKKEGDPIRLILRP